jgi:hypothetical protein
VGTPTAPTFVDSNLTNDTPYYYIVRAVDDSGNESEPSDEVTATPSAGFLATALLGLGRASRMNDYADLDESSPTHAASTPLDTNRDGLVTPLDALLVINALNRISANVSQRDLAIAQMDVNGDGYLSPLDALLVINRLNSIAT